MSQLTDKAIQIAESQIGQHEDPLGSNFGGQVTKYLESVGIDFPASWCSAFIYWCFDQASKSLAIANPLPRTGGVLAMYRATLNFRHQNKPQVGDIFIMDFGRGLGHTGIVESITEDGKYINTIEGNSNSDGSRNGIQVVKHQRSVTNPLIIGYLRF